MPKNYIKNYLSDDDLDLIVRKISEAESKTSGEIRLSIKTNRGYREKDIDAHELAVAEFFNLKMNETKDKTGVLIYILFEDRKFEIIADEGINAKITRSEWESYSEKISDHFRQEKYLEGLIFCIEKIGDRLSKEFPFKSDDTNELSDEVLIS